MILPVAVEELAVNVIAGCAVTFTPVRTVSVVVPMVTSHSNMLPAFRPVDTVAPPPVEVTEPVAAVIAVPRVGAVLFAPEMISVSVSYVVPSPMENAHVDALPALVTLGIVVVTSFDVFAVGIGTLALALLILFITLAVPSAPTAVPLAEALKYLVVAPADIVGLVKVKVVPVPRTVSVSLTSVTPVMALSNFVLSRPDIPPVELIVFPSIVMLSPAVSLSCFVLS